MVFGALHLFNPGATLFSALALALSAGLLLGYAFAATRDLWFVTAIHAGWNITLGNVFGFAVSGNVPGVSFLGGTVEGPELGTGSDFGPEATLQTIIVVAVAGLIFARRSRARRPRWRAAAAARR